MNDLHEDLARRAMRFAPGGDAYDRLLRRAARRQLVRRVTSGVAAIVIAVAAFTGLWSATRTNPAPAINPPPSVSTELPYDGLQIGLSTHVDGWVVLPDSFGVWVAGAGRLFDVNPTTGKVAQTGQGHWDYDFVRLAEYGERSIWLASGSTLSLIDPSTGSTIVRFDLGSIGTIDDVFQDSMGNTWVTADGPGGNVVAQINADSGHILNRHAIGQGTHQMTEADELLFVTSQASPGHSLLRVDPASGNEMWIPGVEPTAIAGIGHKLWLTEGETVRCIDAVLPAADCSQIAIPHATALAADGTDLWVLSATGSTSPTTYLPDPNQPATVTLIDAVTGTVLGGPLALPDSTPASISAYNGHAWIGFHDTGRLLRIDRCAFGSCASQSS